MDWSDLPPRYHTSPPRLIINLVQSIRHANPESPLYRFLKYRAIRVCVSHEVALAIQKTGKVNGPVLVIPAGIDSNQLTYSFDSWHKRPIDFLIYGIKQPDLAKEIAVNLKHSTHRIEVLNTQIRRPHFLEKLSNSKIVVFLPFNEEGCFLPPLEAMSTGTVVICPPFGGAGDYLIENVNYFKPPYNVKGVLEAMLHVAEIDQTSIIEQGKLTAAYYNLDRERAMLFKMLADFGY